MALIFEKGGEFVFPSDFCIPVEKIVSRDRVELNLETTPFYFEFFSGETYMKIRSCRPVSKEEIYIVSFDGTERVNNFYSDEVLRFKFENYPIRRGLIYYK